MHHATVKKLERLRPMLNDLYGQLNQSAYIAPDPLQILLEYHDDRDREVAGLIAALLAYGRVASILNSARRVLSPMQSAPADWLADASPARIRKHLEGFQHRWTRADEMEQLLLGLRKLLRKGLSLREVFLSHHSGQEDFRSAMAGLFRELVGGEVGSNSLAPDPMRPGACKRVHMYLRWMIRRDQVDPGCWAGLDASRLLVPVDVHMLRISRGLGLTKRRQADLRASREITECFRVLEPEDPVRYDFSLTRLGIRPELSLNRVLKGV